MTAPAAPAPLPNVSVVFAPLDHYWSLYDRRANVLFVDPGCDDIPGEIAEMIAANVTAPMSTAPKLTVVNGGTSDGVRRGNLRSV
ncbi:hypothetical protein ACFQ68_28275 [Amycolatopsis japonica]|uniref:hypothetical protein n=1 Tax=Amycolatopsis japonica TaxID=208439 RepID=UPI00366E1B34